MVTTAIVKVRYSAEHSVEQRQNARRKLQKAIDKMHLYIETHPRTAGGWLLKIELVEAKIED